MAVILHFQNVWVLSMTVDNSQIVITLSISWQMLVNLKQLKLPIDFFGDT